MEAGASGLPVIGTRVGGIPEVVLHEQTGLLVEQRDVAGLAIQMTRLAVDGALAARLGQAAAMRVRAHFSVDLGIQKLWTLIQACVAARSVVRSSRAA
jgi:glycosyltransferase involved in cell wall biosynthesis